MLAYSRRPCRQEPSCGQHLQRAVKAMVWRRGLALSIQLLLALPKQLPHRLVGFGLQHKLSGERLRAWSASKENLQRSRLQVFALAAHRSQSLRRLRLQVYALAPSINSACGAGGSNYMRLRRRVIAALAALAYGSLRLQSGLALVGPLSGRFEEGGPFAWKCP